MGYLGFLERMSSKADLMERMMRKLDVRDAITEMPAAPSVLRNAAFRCMTCGHAGECKSWLEENQAPEHAPGYCRNKDLFEFAAGN
ncbi:hypothetical protein EJC49_15675 [Aquibium carbonis]|uniref:DUF6455 domain-containing protein n=1 Tax=Aquibium carbonis TaxID=2495581 RepID=A0A429YVP5_9HYPH|nr:DUF6455 family protein [Aquibium carbonis]RST85525.1 hypothetical protein EJC49_15675 [Aquibium carbonis]